MVDHHLAYSLMAISHGVYLIVTELRTCPQVGEFSSERDCFLPHEPEEVWLHFIHLNTQQIFSIQVSS